LHGIEVKNPFKIFNMASNGNVLTSGAGLLFCYVPMDVSTFILVSEVKLNELSHIIFTKKKKHFCLQIFSSSENHPAMKDVLVREVERLLYRPNISPKGKHQHKWRHWRNFLELFLLASVAKIFTSSQERLNNVNY
jgi:hypothetical protein